MSAQQGLSFGLGVIGAVVGSVTPLGPALGFEIGSAVGSIVGGVFFSAGPPRPSDISVATASEGSAIPLLYGTMRITGQLMYSQKIRAVKSSGGKGSSLGGGQQQYSYYFTGAFLFCETDGNGVAGYLRIWADKKLVADFTKVGSTDTTMSTDPFGFLLDVASGKYSTSKVWVDKHLTFYTGVESQLPDSTIEADKGAGNVPAFRGLCYAVIKDLDVTSNGARPPLIEIEVVQSGVTADASKSGLTSNVLYPWVQSESDPRNCLNDHEYSLDSTTWNDFATIMASVGWDNPVFFGWSTGYSSPVSPFESVDPGDSATLVLFFLRDEPLETYGNIAAGAGGYCALRTADAPFEKVIAWSGRQGFGDAAVSLTTPANYWVYNTLTSGVYPPGYGAVAACDADPSGGNNNIAKLSSVGIYCRRVPRQPDNPCVPRCGSAYPMIPGSTDYCVIDGQGLRSTGWTLVGAMDSTPRYRWLADYYDSTDTLDHPVGNTVNQTVLRSPIGPVLAIGDPLDTEANWTAYYNAAVTAGLLPAGMPYTSNTSNTDPSKYPMGKAYAWQITDARSALTPTDPTIGEICAAICKRAGMDASLYDFGALTKTVHGYAPARLSSARDMLIQPLQAQFGDVTESNGQLVGVVRGGAAVLTLTTDDLRAVEAGQQTPPAVTITRRQPIELPRVLRVHYLDDSNDYQAGQQIGIREYGPPRSPVDMQLAIAMSPDDAAVIADVALNEAYAEREQYQFAVPATDAFLALKPADTINLPVEGKTVLARLLTVNYAFPGLIAFTAARSDAGVYSSSATAITSPPAGTQDLVVLGPSTIELFDCAALSDAGNDAGAYVGVVPAITTDWPGAALSETVDGTTYTDEGAATSPAAAGAISNALGSASQYTWDCYNTLSFTLTTGTAPSSSTDLGVYNGANMAILGADGRWEVIQYRDVTVNADGSYTVSHLLRGRRGTEQVIGTSIAGDTIVLVDANLLRVSETSDAIGVARTLVATTAGTAVGDAPTTSYTPTGAALKPYAPCRLGGGRDASGNITLQWTRRTRISGEMKDGSDVPLGEESEQYVVQIIKGVGTVVRVITASSPTASYSAADQTTDFGAAVTAGNLTWQVAQISAAYGRGTFATGTL